MLSKSRQYKSLEIVLGHQSSHEPNCSYGVNLNVLNTYINMEDKDQLPKNKTISFLRKMTIIS